TVLIDEKHLGAIMSIVPEYYGVWTYRGSKRNVIREATTSPELDAKAQLELFTKRELIKCFQTNDKVVILNEFDSEKVNKLLKEVLKQRYLTRWNFVRDNWESILPIDLQFFFNTNIPPQLIYQG